MKKKFLKLLCAFACLCAILLASGLGYLRFNTYTADSQVHQLAQQADQKENGLTIFKGQADKPSLIFYQGALVQADSYAFLGSKLAAQGYTVYIIHSPLNLPILNSQKARQIIQDFKLDSQQVFLGGHSLGGVAASANAAQLAKEKQPIKGLILLASYPSQSADLSDTGLPVLSITASQDQIIKWDQYEKAKKLLPAGTNYQEIEGGNHSGFGLYGQQKGDGQPTISALEQQEELVHRIASFMEREKEIE